MNKPTNYIVKGKLHILNAIRKDMHKFLHVPSYPPVDGKLSIKINSSIELATLQELCAEYGVKYYQE